MTINIFGNNIAVGTNLNDLFKPRISLIKLIKFCFALKYIRKIRVIRSFNQFMDIHVFKSRGLSLFSTRIFVEKQGIVYLCRL